MLFQKSMSKVLLGDSKGKSEYNWDHQAKYHRGDESDFSLKERGENW